MTEEGYDLLRDTVWGLVFGVLLGCIILPFVVVVVTGGF